LGRTAKPSALGIKEDFMFARLITLEIKNDQTKEFPQIFGREILPLLKKQRGFRDELLLVTPGKNEATAISLWDTKEEAELYNKETYPEVTKIMNKFVTGIPVVKNLEVEFATLPKFEKIVTVPAN
jgi:heme-degrading monooxygenase HmoA